MITIQKEKDNIVYLTLLEKTTITGATYLFVLTNDLTKEVKAFIPPALGIEGVYIKFSITDNPTEQPLNGVMSFSPTGYWHYTIYQQTSATNLNPNDAEGIVETGKAHVTGTPYENHEYENLTQRNYVYVN